MGYDQLRSTTMALADSCDHCVMPYPECDDFKVPACVNGKCEIVVPDAGR